MFAYEIFVLDQGSLERLKNHPGPAQRFRKGVALEQLIVCENQTPRFTVEHRRSFEDLSLFIIGRWIPESIGGKVERIFHGKLADKIVNKSVHAQAHSLRFTQAALLHVKNLLR